MWKECVAAVPTHSRRTKTSQLGERLIRDSERQRAYKEQVNISFESDRERVDHNCCISDAIRLHVAHRLKSTFTAVMAKRKTQVHVHEHYGTPRGSSS